MGAKSVSVYRKYQPQWWSPCVLGDPCEVCKAHLRGKKRNTECLRAIPATPAFSLPIKTAIALVKDGLACFIHRNTAIQLTFAKIAHLRDRSLRIDENFLMAYAADRKWARIRSTTRRMERRKLSGWNGQRHRRRRAGKRRGRLHNTGRGDVAVLRLYC